MDTLQFLRLVLPDAGFKILAIPGRTRGFQHASFTRHEGLADAARDHADAHDVYYAVAGYRERKVLRTLPDGTQKVSVRLATNVEALRTFWLDIDVGESKPYQTKRDAAAAVATFCRDTGIHPPLIVDSGGGLHCYWPLSADVSPGDWHVSALMLKSLTVAAGLKADPVRTADMASVLRVPGTTNHKGGNRRPVALVRDAAKVVSHDQMRALLAMACERLQVLPAQPRAPKAESQNDDLLGGMDSPPADPKPILALCGQMRRIATQQETASEPEWFAAIQVVRHCANPVKVAHAISRKHPSYTPGQVDLKLANLEEKGIGPTTCTRFESLNSAACAACAYRGKITSPIQLGRTKPAAAPAPVVQVAAQAQVGAVTFTLPDSPEPYVRTQDGKIAIVLEDENGVKQAPMIIYHYDLYPVKRTIDEFTGRVRTTFRTVQPMAGEYEFELDNQDLYDSRALPKALANADMLPSPAKLKLLGDYMVSYTQRLQQVAEATKLFMQMGWRDDSTKFIVGSTMIVPNEPPRTIGVSSATSLAAEKLVANGSLDEWKKVVATYTRPGWEPYLFGFATAFGAPLFGFTNYHGAIINMMSRSGTGKSTVLRAMNSVYGHPDALMFSKDDTVRSFYRRIGVYNSLPIAFDEITNIDPKELSDLAYTFSQGRERMRLTAAATERKDAYKWQTIMAATANSSLHEKLGALKADAQAESVRIFEYRMPDSAPMDSVAAKATFDKLFDHYGVAGPVYLQYLLDNKDWAIAQLKKIMDAIFRAANSPSHERFWVAVVAANVTGLLVAQKAGLIQVDAKALTQWAIEQIKAQRASVAEATTDPIEAIGMFLNAHIRDTLVIDMSSNGLGISTTLRKPTNELHCRYEPDLGRMYVDRSRLKKWCSSNNVGYTWLRRELRNRFVLLDTDARRCLGASTDFASAQVGCWVLDMKTAHMGAFKPSLVQGEVIQLNKGATQ